MLAQPCAEIALSGREMMNVETLAIKSEELLTAHQAADSTSEQTLEITLLPPESCALVGGGESIVLF
jgi:hypothetical protein